MCTQAKANRDICEQRQRDVGPVGANTHGRSGQAGAFGDCAALYGAVANMRTASKRARPPRRRPTNRPLKACQCRRCPPLPAPPAKPADATDRIGAPPPLRRAARPRRAGCAAARLQLRRRAQANDGPTALAGWQSR